jgi:hypothetical protein
MIMDELEKFVRRQPVPLFNLIFQYSSAETEKNTKT